MLGSTLEPNMTASTKKNLAWRVDCEYGATAGKFELAKVAKKNNLDAIHDTVHEMARDEARHGKAFEWHNLIMKSPYITAAQWIAEIGDDKKRAIITAGTSFR